MPNQGEKNGSDPNSTVRELTLEARRENIPSVTDIVDELLEAMDCPRKTRMQIDMAIDEVLANIASYAYVPEVGPVTVRIETEPKPRAVVITFVDRGRPYNPLTAESPDVTAPLNERKIGGLGIFLIRKMMDTVEYTHRDGQNILCIKKYLEPKKGWPEI